MKKYNIAIVGATGMVGRKMLQVLEEQKLPIDNLIPFASAKSAGSTIKFDGKDYVIVELSADNIRRHKVDIALFSAGGSVSKEYAPIFAKEGTIVIDNSSQWRTDPNVPLVVPEVNADDILRHRNIIANPNCSTIQAMVVLGPLDKAFSIKRVVYSTYQAVSGAGVGGHEDLKRGINGEAPLKFPRPIFNNCLPHIDVFLDNGYTKEEEKMMFETRKILRRPDLKVTATTVRVPIFNSHSESINLEFNNPVNAGEVRKVLENADGVVVVDEPSKLSYPTALDANDTDPVYVGRIRNDESVENGINLWVVADNIRKGAATNTVQIAKYIIENNIPPVKL